MAVVEWGRQCSGRYECGSSGHVLSTFGGAPRIVSRSGPICDEESPSDGHDRCASATGGSACGVKRTACWRRVVGRRRCVHEAFSRSALGRRGCAECERGWVDDACPRTYNKRLHWKFLQRSAECVIVAGWRMLVDWRCGVRHVLPRAMECENSRLNALTDWALPVYD